MKDTLFASQCELYFQFLEKDFGAFRVVSCKRL